MRVSTAWPALAQAPICEIPREASAHQKTVEEEVSHLTDFEHYPLAIAFHKMRLITHNSLRCNRKDVTLGYPLGLEVGSMKVLEWNCFRFFVCLLN